MGLQTGLVALFRFFVHCRVSSSKLGPNANTLTGPRNSRTLAYLSHRYDFRVPYEAAKLFLFGGSRVDIEVIPANKHMLLLVPQEKKVDFIPEPPAPVANVRDAKPTGSCRCLVLQKVSDPFFRALQGSMSSGGLDMRACLMRQG